MNHLSLSAAAIFALASTGCSFTKNTIPEAPIQFAKSDYTILGDTSEKDCGAYIAGINFATLFSAKTASTGGGGGDPVSAVLSIAGLGGGSPEQGAALYNALEKVPNATHLIQPRVSTSVVGIAPGGFPIFAQRCSEVKALAVKVGGPNAQQ